MIRKIIVLFAVLMILSASSVMAQGTGKEKMAILAAEKWLSMVDQGKYAESWKEAAEYFRAAVKQDQWEQSLTAVRKPLGRLISRKVKTNAYKTSLPGPPRWGIRGDPVRDLLREEERSGRNRNSHEGQGREVAGLRLLYQIANLTTGLRFAGKILPNRKNFVHPDSRRPRPLAVEECAIV
jgi:hypothetical protein